MPLVFSSKNTLGQAYKVPAGSTDVHVVTVSPGNRASLGVGDPQGGTYNVVNYKFTEAEYPDRLLHVSEGNLTGVYSKTSLGGFRELGIQFTVPPAADVLFEVLEGDF